MWNHRLEKYIYYKIGGPQLKKYWIYDDFAECDKIYRYIKSNIEECGLFLVNY